MGPLSDMFRSYGQAAERRPLGRLVCSPRRRDHRLSSAEELERCLHFQSGGTGPPWHDSDRPPKRGAIVPNSSLHGGIHGR
jgi:hypothetical protein